MTKDWVHASSVPERNATWYGRYGYTTGLTRFVLGSAVAQSVGRSPVFLFVLEWFEFAVGLISRDVLEWFEFAVGLISQDVLEWFEFAVGLIS